MCVVFIIFKCTRKKMYHFGKKAQSAVCALELWFK